ncbi:MAG: hypothetical protein V2I33_18560 [Kangiellaceae bacterium]|nr:hypothetical protein [Kangiellaceae bacterium]
MYQLIYSTAAYEFCLSTFLYISILSTKDSEPEDVPAKRFLSPPGNYCSKWGYQNMYITTICPHFEELTTSDPASLQEEILNSRSYFPSQCSTCIAAFVIIISIRSTLIVFQGGLIRDIIIGGAEPSGNLKLNISHLISFIHYFIFICLKVTESSDSLEGLQAVILAEIAGRPTSKIENVQTSSILLALSYNC